MEDSPLAGLNMVAYGRVSEKMAQCHPGTELYKMQRAAGPHSECRSCGLGHVTDGRTGRTAETANQPKEDFVQQSGKLLQSLRVSKCNVQCCCCCCYCCCHLLLLPLLLPPTAAAKANVAKGRLRTTPNNCT